MASTLRIGFLGAGKMASALAKGFIGAKIVSPKQIAASDVVEAARAGFARDIGSTVVTSNLEVLRFANVVILAVKPDHVPAVLNELKPGFTEKHLLISIAAGVTLARIEEALPLRARVMRVMPNTPALVGAGASGYALGSHANGEDGELAQKLLGAVGVAFAVKEQLLDAVTGLSGSGPAYGFQIIEAMSDGGVAAGLPRDVSTRLAAQTLLGAAKMVLETGLHPGALKDMVTSPGGTTIEGLHELEKGKVRGALINAVRAASEKSRKLGEA
jgi:pyrroline-5-carboxylate reductase